MTALAPTLQSFFTNYLIGQRAASQHTITAYRDTWRLLLDYALGRTGIAPIPIDAITAEVLANWLTENPGQPEDPLFTARGTSRKMTTDAVAQRVATHIATATTTCPALAGRTVSPHVLRHTTAMRMLTAGIDITTIALWLGHESPESTPPYLHADLALKQRALDRTAPPGTAPGRYAAPDYLLAFLENL